MLLIARARTQSMREILGDLHAFSGVFDLVVGNMTSVSRDIVEYVIRPTLQSVSAHVSQVTASLDVTLARLSRQQSELQTHTLLEVSIIALCSMRSMTKPFPGGHWCFPSLGRGTNTGLSRTLR